MNEANKQSEQEVDREKSRKKPNEKKKKNERKRGIKMMKKKSKSHKCYKCNISLKRSIKFSRRLLLNISVPPMIWLFPSSRCSFSFFPCFSSILCQYLRFDRRLREILHRWNSKDRKRESGQIETSWNVCVMLSWLGLRVRFSLERAQEATAAASQWNYTIILPFFY